MSNKITTKQMAALIIAAISITACTSNSDEPSLSSVATEEMEVVSFEAANTLTSRHTDEAFEDGDVIYVYPLRNGEFSLPNENRKYQFVGDMFAKTYYTSDITKKTGETLTYFAINEYERRNGNEFTLRSGDRDYLVAAVESDASHVELTFTHFMSLLWIDVKNAPASIRKVTLLDIDTEIEIDGTDLTLSYDPLPGTEVPMSYSSTYDSYAYFVPPCTYPDKGEPFIRVYLNNGVTYLFGPPSDTRFESNQQYIWETDLRYANPETSYSRSAEQSVNHMTMVSEKTMSGGENITLKFREKSIH